MLTRRIWTCTFRILVHHSTCWAIKSWRCKFKSCSSQHFSVDFGSVKLSWKISVYGRLVFVSFEKMCNLNNHNRLKASDASKSANANLCMLLNHQIEDSEDSIYAMVRLFVFFFFDPKNWTDKKNYGNNAITSFANHFQANLLATRYDLTKVLNEIILSLAQYCWNQKRAVTNVLRIVQLAQIILKILIFFIILIKILLKQKAKKVINIKLNHFNK